MEGKLGRRGFCAAAVVASAGGCIGVLGRDRERITATRSSPPTEKSWELEMSPQDRVTVEYNPTGSEPSRMVVEGPDGVVVYDDTISERGRLRYTATDAGLHTVRFVWGDRARIDLYLES